jgi:predicted alpha/beta-fold hydrolase
MIRIPAVVLASLFVAGCGFDQRSFPLERDELVLLDGASAAEAVSARVWLREAQDQLQPLLAREDRRDTKFLLTEDLVSTEGRPIDVYRWFGRDPDGLLSIFRNFSGIRDTAQVSGRAEAIDEASSAWPGFEQVWIPIRDDLALSGRLGLARRDGRVISAPCIVVLPGLFGDNGVKRMQDVSTALQRAGFHALALEMRGHGQTEHRYPDIYYTFGVLETRDLLVVSDWLEDEVEGVASTGMVGYCWGGNLALLAAWYDGCRPDHPSIIPEVAAHLDGLPARHRYRAGVIAYSPVLRWEEILDLCDVDHSKYENPMAFFFQDTLRRRSVMKNHPEVTGSLRKMIEFEFARSEFGPDYDAESGYRTLRLLPYNGKPDDDKLESARVPVLIVSAANDPFIPAQHTADLIAQTQNPGVSALILRGGGHIGFVADNRAYFYSLLINFFAQRVDAMITASH